MSSWLYRNGLATVSIHGDREQHAREHALRLFKSGRCRVMVATDVASRGLHIPNIRCVCACVRARARA